MWTALIGVFSQIFQGWTETKKAKTEAKVRAMQSSDVYSASVLEAQGQGWKDEFLVVTFTAPYWALFYGAIFEKPEVIEGVENFFKATSDMPGMYWLIIGTMVVGTFGTKAIEYWRAHTKGMNKEGT